MLCLLAVELFIYSLLLQPSYLLSSTNAWGMATLVEIAGQLQDNQGYSGTIWAKVTFQDPSGTQVE